MTENTDANAANEPPASTLSDSLQITVVGYSDQALAEGHSNYLYQVLHVLGRYMDLGEVVGASFGYDYDEALRNVDRGRRDIAPLERTNDHVVGIAMCAAVMRGEHVRSYLIFHASVVEFVSNAQGEHFAQALQVIAHECAHAHSSAAFVSAFPGFLLERQVHHIATSHMHRAWDEYSACRIAARIGEDPTEYYRETFAEALQVAEENAVASIEAVRRHEDWGRLANEVYAAYGSLMVYAAYYIGNEHGFDRDVIGREKDVAGLIDSYFQPFYERLVVGLSDIFDQFGNWSGRELFDVLDELLVDLVEDRGVQVSELDNGNTWVQLT